MKKNFDFALFPLKEVILPLLLWIAITPWLSELDLTISHFFYHEGQFSSHYFWQFFYDYGLLFAEIVTGVAFIGCILSFIKFSSWRKPCFFLILAFLIGPILIVNLSFKEHWGRPRPVQTTEFGGKQPFRPYYQPNFFDQPEPSKSFPCGHCSLGFYFFSFVFLGRVYHSQRLFWIGMILALSLGILLSLARIAQGGHFFSDTLASALIVWLTNWGFTYLIFPQKQLNYERFNA